jgi:hypothetical protein
VYPGVTSTIENYTGTAQTPNSRLVTELPLTSLWKESCHISRNHQVVELFVGVIARPLTLRSAPLVAFLHNPREMTTNAVPPHRYRCKNPPTSRILTHTCSSEVKISGAPVPFPKGYSTSVSSLPSHSQ